MLAATALAADSTEYLAQEFAAPTGEFTRDSRCDCFLGSHPRDLKGILAWVAAPRHWHDIDERNRVLALIDVVRNTGERKVLSNTSGHQRCRHLWEGHRSEVILKMPEERLTEWFAKAYAPRHKRAGEVSLRGASQEETDLCDLAKSVKPHRHCFDVNNRHPATHKAQFVLAQPARVPCGSGPVFGALRLRKFCGSDHHALILSNSCRFFARVRVTLDRMPHSQRKSLIRSIATGFTVSLVAAIMVSTAGCTAGAGPVPTQTKTQTAKPKESPKPPEPEPEPAPEPEPEPEPEPAAPALSIDDPNSIWVIVNKLRPFDPMSYVPDDLVTPSVSSTNGQPLRAEAAAAAEQMAAAAAAAGAPIHMVSGYRSYDTQVSVYGSFVASIGQAAADTTSARPGHSEHQTGLAADFGGADGCTLDTCFADTAAGLWLAEHGADYGFVLRYPNGLESITGYHFEPWHYRYVGTDLAQTLRANGTRTLEEHFGLPHAGNYAE